MRKAPGEVLLPVRVKPSGGSSSNKYYLQDTTSIGQCEPELKRIYEACYPETKRGENQHTRGVPDSGNPQPRYTKAKAETTGVSEPKIQEEIQLTKAIERRGCQILLWQSTRACNRIFS